MQCTNYLLSIVDGAPFGRQTFVALGQINSHEKLDLAGFVSEVW